MNRTYEYPILITLVMVHRNDEFLFKFDKPPTHPIK